MGLNELDGKVRQKFNKENHAAGRKGVEESLLNRLDRRSRCRTIDEIERTKVTHSTSHKEKLGAKGEEYRLSLSLYTNTR